MATSTIKDSSVHTKVISKTITIGADGRNTETISMGLPSGAQVIGLFIRNGFNLDWIRTNLRQDGSNVIAYMHNEYGGSLSGTLSVVVAYTLD